MQILLKKSIPNHQATERLAQEIWEKHLAPEANFTLFLEGALGAGKTVIVREVLTLAGITERISSPTYTYVHQYEAHGRSFAHFDLFRLEDETVFFEKGLSEIAADTQVSCFTEWGKKLSPEVRKQFSGTHFVLEIRHGIGVGMREVVLLESQ